MTTPSKLSLKKKSKQKTLIPAARDDQEEEKENVPGASIVNSSSKSSRRCSTIIAGNLFLEQRRHDFTDSTHTTSARREKRRNTGLGDLGQVHEEDDDRRVSGEVITEDESSFYSCPSSPPDKHQEHAGDHVKHHGLGDINHREDAVLGDTWMTELSVRHTPQNKPGQGRIIFLLS